MTAAEDEDDEEVVPEETGAAFCVDVMNVVIVDPPGAVDVTTDVTTVGLAVVVGVSAAAVVVGSFVVVVGAASVVLVVGVMTALDVEITLMTVWEVVDGESDTLVEREVVSSVVVTGEGLLLAMELEESTTADEDDTAAAEELVWDAVGV